MDRLLLAVFGLGATWVCGVILVRYTNEALWLAYLWDVLP